MTDALTHNDLRVGDELPVFERDVGFANWNRFAAVNDEFVPIHMDDNAGRAAGYDGAFGMGNLHVAYIHCVLRTWLGVNGRVTILNVQFRAPSLRGPVNRARGVVARIDTTGTEPIIELDVWVEDGAEQRLTRGTAQVVLTEHPNG